MAGTLPAPHYRKVCSRSRYGCSFVQHYGYHSAGTRVQYDDNWNTLEFLVVTRETGFEMKFLRKYDVEVLIGQISYKQKSDIYNSWNNYVNGEDRKSKSYHGLEEREKLDRRRLECGYLLFCALNVYKWYPEFSQLEFDLGELDQVLLKILPQYHLAFSTKYAEHHCLTPGCKNVIVMDGNMKNHRDVCKATEAGYIKFDGLLGQVKTGCQKTPDFKSRYCTLHKPRVCSVSKMDDQHNLTIPTEAVVEMVLEKKVTRTTTYYKVLVLGQEDVSTMWYKEEDLVPNILDEYNNKIEPDRELQSINLSGESTVTAIVKHRNSENGPVAKKPHTEHLNTSTDGPLLKNDGDGVHLTCRTEKDKHSKLNLETAGILAGMQPYGIILFVNELFISESLTQVYGILHEFMRRHKNFTDNLEFICYDDGCHLRKFCHNPKRRDITPTTKKMASLSIVVDKMHIAGHVDAWCLETCDARKVKALDEVDTQICEQTFAWLSRYAKITRKMKQEHFLFYLLYICDLHNRRQVLQKH